MRILNGFGVNNKIAIGNAYVINTSQNTTASVICGNPAQEAGLLEQAVEKSRQQIELLIKNSEETIKNIIQVQLDYLEDPELVGQAKKLINNKNCSAASAILQVTKDLYDTLYSIDDDVIKERAVDIKDVGDRIYKNIAGMADIDLSNLKKNTVLIAKELTPSQAALLDIRNVVAFITEKGTQTSHISIMAKAMGIAAVVGCTDAVSQANNGDTIIVDAKNGQG